MQIPVQITFRDMGHSDAIEAYVLKQAAKLETLSHRITACHVVVEAPHKHRQHGRHVRILIDLSIPGREIVVSRAQSDDRTTEDAYAAIDQAFDRVGRRLEDHLRRQRVDVKPRSTRPFHASR